MIPLTRADYSLIRAGLSCLAQEHRTARDEAEKRAADRVYEYRREAVQAANFHASEANRISLLVARVFALESRAE